MSYQDPEELFKIVSQIGQGAFGCIYLAINKKTQQYVAIKQVKTKSNEEIQSLKREIQILKDCHNQNIVQYYGSYQKQANENDIWLVMEYCKGGSVIDLIRKHKVQLCEKQIATILQDTLKGLNYLHQNKKIHRDVKAGNILLDENGNAKLADFGVSAQLEHTLADTKTFTGSPYWMSPEISSHSHYNKKTDIWSLGITAIELAEGVPPYHNIHPVKATMFIKRNPVRSLTNKNKWSQQFNDFVEICLTIDPQNRPLSEELLQHPFIRNSCDKGTLKQLVQQNEIVEIKLESEEEENNQNSMIIHDSEEQQYIFSEETGTMIINEDCDTMIVHDKQGPKQSDFCKFYAEHCNDESDIQIQTPQNHRPNKSKSPQNNTSSINNSNNNTNNKVLFQKKENQDVQLSELNQKKEKLIFDMNKEIQIIKERYNGRINEVEMKIKQVKPTVPNNNNNPKKQEMQDLYKCTSASLSKYTINNENNQFVANVQLGPGANNNNMNQFKKVLENTLIGQDINNIKNNEDMYNQLKQFNHQNNMSNISNNSNNQQDKGNYQLEYSFQSLLENTKKQAQQQFQQSYFGNNQGIKQQTQQQVCKKALNNNVNKVQKVPQFNNNQQNYKNNINGMLKNQFKPQQPTFQQHFMNKNIQN